MEFSWIGLIMIVLMLAPNFIYFIAPVKNMPSNMKDAGVFFTICERIGQVGCFLIPVLFSRFDLDITNASIIWPILIIICIGIYYYLWLRYFINKAEFKYLFSSFMHIFGPMAVFPILAFAFMALWGSNIYMGIATIVFAIGHIANTMYTIKHYIGNKDNKE